MNTIARIVFLMAIVLVSVARIGAGDDEQTGPSLFDQVRLAFPKLKSEMTFDEAKRVLMVDKLNPSLRWGVDGATFYSYDIKGDVSQKLNLVSNHDSEKNSDLIYSAELCRSDNVVVRFDPHKQ